MKNAMLAGRQEIKKIFILLVIFLTLPNFALATPSINGISGTVSHDANVIINGSGFGNKTISTPFYYSNFDSEITGEIPMNQVTNTSGHGTVETNVYRGKKSLEFEYAAEAGVKQGDWKRNVIDFGAQGTDKIFMSFWLYLDKGESTSASWQWKNYVITSCSSYYVCNDDFTPFVIFEPWYWTNRWGNSGSPHVYTGSGEFTTFGAVSDEYLFGQWQKIEMNLQRSSTGGANNGKVFLNRVGRSASMHNATNVITHDVGDSPWRYISLSQAIESVYDGFVNLSVYMDDVYIDTTQSHIELCDSLLWLDRTHCETQTPITWSTTNVSVNINQGSFADYSSAYLYVLDSSGTASANGFPITFGAGAEDTTAPTAPTELSVL